MPRRAAAVCRRETVERRDLPRGPTVRARGRRGQRVGVPEQGTGGTRGECPRGLRGVHLRGAVFFFAHINYPSCIIVAGWVIGDWMMKPRVCWGEGMKLATKHKSNRIDLLAGWMRI